jgi:lipopolysaccharide export system permease protein
MKRIDRYIARGYIVRFIAVVLVIFGLYVSFDAVKRIDEIQQGAMEETLPKVLAYYAYQFPTRILDIVAPLLLVAGGLVLVQMSRHGELLTLKASGISLRRTMLPIFICTVPVVGLAFWARESLVPWAFQQEQLLNRELEQKRVGPFLIRDEVEDYKLFVGRYDFSEHTMERVSLLRFYPDGGVRRVLEADNGRWGDGGKIHLETISIQEYDESGNPVDRPEVHTSKSIESSLRPYDFVEAKEDAMRTSLPTFTLLDLHHKVQRNPQNPRFRVMLHSRLAEPLAAFVLLLIGLPLLVGFEHSMQSRVLGAVVCILVAAGFKVLSFVALSMGNTGLIPPLWAAWFMPAVGGGIGLILFARMRT